MRPNMFYHVHGDYAIHILPCACWLCYILFIISMMNMPYKFYYVRRNYAIYVFPCAWWLCHIFYYEHDEYHVHVDYSKYLLPCTWWICHKCFTMCTMIKHTCFTMCMMITPYLPFEVLGMIIPYLLCQVLVIFMLYFPCCAWLLNTIPAAPGLSDPKGLSSSSVLSLVIFALLQNSEGLMQNIEDIEPLFKTRFNTQLVENYSNWNTVLILQTTTFWKYHNLLNLLRETMRGPVLTWDY